MNSNLLFVTSSLFGEQSQSSTLAHEFLSAWRQQHPHATITTRRLAPHLMPHLDADMWTAWLTPESERTVRQSALNAFSDTLVAELEAADAIVIAVPMYNFSIPSTLKAWIDHVARAGRTFRYTASGPVGLLKGKKVFVVTARGGLYGEGMPAHPFDFQVPYLKAVLGFLGLDDVTFVHLEGLKVSAEAANEGRSRARAAIAALVPERAAAA